MMNNEVKVHYASPGLYERIVQGLEAIGKPPASMDLDDLAALDEFHLRGLRFTPRWLNAVLFGRIVRLMQSQSQQQAGSHVESAALSSAPRK